MTKTYVKIDLKELQEYQTFNNINRMDEVIYNYIEVLNNDEIRQSAIDLLLFYGSSSLRIPGVSFASQKTIAKKIGVSIRTVGRAMQVLLNYGMIQKLETVAKWRKSVDVIQISPTMSEHVDVSEEVEEATPEKATGDVFEKQPYLNNQVPNNYILDTAGAVKNNIPSVIYDNLSPFFNAKDLQRITGVIFRGKAHKHAKIRLEDYEDQYKSVFLDVIRRYKRGTIENLDSYLFKSVRKLTRNIFVGIA